MESAEILRLRKKCFILEFGLAEKLDLKIIKKKILFEQLKFKPKVSSFEVKRRDTYFEIFRPIESR